jgi:hypothetical protein
VSRALVRISRKEMTNAARTRNAVPVPGVARLPNGSTSKIALASMALRRNLGAERSSIHSN